MRIKRYSIVILFLFVFLYIKATGQSCDVIYINGEKWWLMARPIDKDSALYARLRDFLPENHCMSTANWDGYTAFWKIEDSCLYLQRMEICVYDKASRKDSTLIYHTDALKTLFTPYYENGRIPARWFSGELRAGKGDLVRYVHSGFDRNMETEQVILLRQGRIRSVRTYHNFKQHGIKILESQDEIIRRFPWHRFPKYKGQRLIFSIRNIQCTPDGHLLDFDVRTLLIRPKGENIEDRNHPLVKAFKETLKSIYPWEILFINGKYTMEPPSCVLGIWEKNDLPSKTDNDTTEYSIIGKVYGEEVRQIPPYDVIKRPLTGSNLRAEGLPFQGWLTDSTGTFRIKHLKKGQCLLRAEFIGLNPCDTLVTVSGTTCADTLQLVLTLPYDYIEEYVCSPELSREYINKGHPNLKLVIPIEQDKKVREHIFWKKYGVKYYSYYPLKENGKMDCYLNTPNRLLTAYNREVFRYLDEKFGKTWREEVPSGIFGLDKSLDELRDESWLIKTLNRRCKYPIVWQKKNKGRVLRVAYEVNQDGYITTATILGKTPRTFRKSVLDVLQSLRNKPTVLCPGKDTLCIQYRLDTMPLLPKADVVITGYSTCDQPVLMRYDATLIAHTPEPHLEAGVPVCYLNERGDTIVPYGRYKFCQTDTIKGIGFVYEDKPRDARIVCINDAGKKLFYVVECDNGPDYVKEGLFRIMDEKGLMGFADSSGHIIITPQFKFAYPFEGGKAKVTFTGKQKVVSGSDGEKHYWDSKEWRYINRRCKFVQP